MDQGSTMKRSAVHNFAPTVTKFCVMWEGQALPHDTKFGNSRCEIVGRRVIFIWSLIHGLRWSGLIKAEPDHQHCDCLWNWFFRLMTKKTSKLCVTGAWNPMFPGGFPSQRACNVESISESLQSSCFDCCRVTQDGLWGRYCDVILACEISIVMSFWMIVFEILLIESVKTTCDTRSSSTWYYLVNIKHEK